MKLSTEDIAQIALGTKILCDALSIDDAIDIFKYLQKSKKKLRKGSVEEIFKDETK